MGQSITATIDTAQDGYPLRPDIVHYLHLSDERLRECLESAQSVLASCQSDLSKATWYSDGWLRQVINDAPNAFDRAFGRWRDMYRGADRQLQEARAIIDRSHQTRVSRDETEAAERRQAEATRQKDLLCNQNDSGESDFYPYRYLASEGFLPGYNFPRLPIRAFIATGAEKGEFVSRPRFLALSEFGPSNIIYHDGRKYLVTRSQIPGGDPASRFVRAKICKQCGYFHEADDAGVDICQGCGARLDAYNSDYSEQLFAMTDVITRRRQRISCDEEERSRKGYRVSTHYRVASGPNGLRRQVSTVTSAGGQLLLSLEYGPAATLWRINNGWRSSREAGFRLDPASGTWLSQSAEDNEAEGETQLAPGAQPIVGVRILVQDTRNILLVRPSGQVDEAFLATLQAALQRGIEVVFQIEEGELAAERIGKDEQRSVMLWEAAEGGLGVLARLVEDSSTLAAVAKAALDICHFREDGSDSQPPEDADGCARACYRCLLSYSNQPDHRLLDRHLLRDLLLNLASSVASRQQAGRSYDDQYQWLHERTDPASELERRVLDHLYRTRRSLPDHAQPSLSNYPARPDFYYDATNACVFCDGSVHDSPQVQAEDRQVRTALEDLGYRVVAIRYDRDLEEQIAAHADVFGQSTTEARP